jgi:Mn2+/Fe2+ NRAMP family transporter
MLAIPVLASSCAYAIAEAAGWRAASLNLRPRRAPKFYSVIALSIFVGIGFVLLDVSPMKMLFWSAIVNGLLAPPLIVIVVLITSDRKVMGSRANSAVLATLGWICAAVMTVSAGLLVISLGHGGSGDH